MNFTVYCGGISDSDENTIRAAFSPYGRILEIRYFRDKGYAFVRYDNKVSACSAIVAINGTDIGSSSVKCSWGKENARGRGRGGRRDDRKCFLTTSSALRSRSYKCQTLNPDIVIL